MKNILLASALFLAAPLAHAACSAGDFTIQDFEVAAGSTGLGSRMSMKGQLVSHCAEAAAAQIEIQAKDASGKVIASRKGWPAGTTNIGPGKAVGFDLGRQFHYIPGMKNYTIAIVNVRAW
ncbi:MAG: hypothetical protein M3Y93_13325 [Pseudomonadota bacterium]|nr:hypothetical protein [Pseudomonadota bacterium]